MSLVLRGVELLGPGVVEFAKLSVKDGSLELSSSSGKKTLLVCTSLEELKKELEKLGSTQ